ncbi:hypothetical protein MMC11_007929 [Xylographa trunciseda]|nr:hypothetical protein [Xylographa trunciseda]
MSSLVYGCYYFTSPHSIFFDGRAKCRLPLVGSEAHTTILSTNSRTKLHQTFTNNTGTAIPECIYAFPLYDGVSVVKFTCNVGGRLLRGIVKEKNAARTTYNEAVAKGETAGLLEQLPEASDVFSTKLGNIPAGEVVIVEIEYVGELKQDAETNGIRFTIPTSIAPRYGSVSNTTNISNSSSVYHGGIKIVVDAQMPSGSFIQGIQSPSHPIAVTMGTTSIEPQTEPSMTKASATLALGETGLDKDFVLIVLAKDTGTPKAILETHPTIPNQRALMLTLVPKFALPPSRPEIVFVADRSGSMEGNIPMLTSAMKVFLKSMPLGVKFNICSFGSSHSFLYSKSVSYTQETLAASISHVESFQADMGGTDTFAAIKATIERRFKDIPLEIILLTDGDIWQQAGLFSYVNEEVAKSKGDIRAFPLGIGRGVSHALIEGIARAGNGFAQTVQDGEKLENRLVRMLKGALSPHVMDYSLEVKYGVEKEDDEFEMVEVFDKVTEDLKTSVAEAEKEKPKPQSPISLFDTSETSTHEEKPIPSGDRYADLPDLLPPKLIQAPHKIPPLFPFNRTSVYLLMSPDTMQKNPISVILRGTSTHGPLELEIPVEVLSVPGETIHQLAAKKVMQELEEGRGWIFDAKDDKGVLLSKNLPSKFSDMVEREAVRLGVQFQIAGKSCSFVAVGENDTTGDEGKHQAQLDMVNTGKSESEPHTVDSSSRSESLKRKASTAIPGGLFKYHALMGTSLGQRARRYANRLPQASPERSSPSGSNLLDRSNLRELAATNTVVLQGNNADISATAETNTNETSPAGTHSFRQRAFNGRRTILGSLTGSFRSQPQPAPGAGALFGSSNNHNSTRAPSSQPHIYFSAPTAPTAGYGSPSGSTNISAFHGARRCALSTPPEANAAPARVETIHRMEAPAPIAYSASSAATPAGPPHPVTRGGGGGGGGGNTDAETVDMDGASAFTQALEASDSSASDSDAGARGTPRASAAPRRQLASKAARRHVGVAIAAAPPAPVDWAAAADAHKVLRVIALQGFEGCWDWHADLRALLGLRRVPEAEGVGRKVWATVLVVAWLRGRMGAEEGVWELVVEKAEAWLAGAAEGADVAALEVEARRLVRG